MPLPEYDLLVSEEECVRRGWSACTLQVSTADMERQTARHLASSTSGSSSNPDQAAPTSFSSHRAAPLAYANESEGEDSDGEEAGSVAEELPWRLEGNPWLGRRIRRIFGNVVSDGSLTKWLPAGEDAKAEPALWHAVHDDGDEEDLEAAEAEEAMVAFDSGASIDGASPWLSNLSICPDRSCSSLMPCSG